MIIMKGTIWQPLGHFLILTWQGQLGNHHVISHDGIERMISWPLSCFFKFNLIKTIWQLLGHFFCDGHAKDDLAVTMSFSCEGCGRDDLVVAKLFLLFNYFIWIFSYLGTFSPFLVFICKWRCILCRLCVWWFGWVHI